MSLLKINGLIHKIKNIVFYFRRICWIVFFALLVIFFMFIYYTSINYKVSLFDGAYYLARMAAMDFLYIIHRSDIEEMNLLIAQYYVFGGESGETASIDKRFMVEAKSSFLIEMEDKYYLSEFEKNIPFVYANINSPELLALRKIYGLEGMIKKEPTEYHKMLKLANWLGTRWAHGVDLLPGQPKSFDPVEVVNSGVKGAKYWCEIAAELTVLAGASLGWPARLVTLSRDGYTHEHAVAEYWSNQFSKWFVVDTDYNVIYESEGIPLSAFELCHYGLKLQKDRKLKIRRIAPVKQGITVPDLDLLPFYKYVLVDMRSDWRSRQLEPGSPAGSDSASWWTARAGAKEILTVSQRVDDIRLFNWPVNVTKIEPTPCAELGEREKGACLPLHLEGYSPYFAGWEYSLDNGNWLVSGASGTINVNPAPGRHWLKARMRLTNNSYGPSSVIFFTVTCRFDNCK